jgi:hypothetical protein
VIVTRARLAAFLAGFTIHFASVGLFALADGVLWPSRPDLLALSENPGWYLHGGLVAPLFWAAFAPFLAAQGRGLATPAVIAAAGAAAVAVNAVFFSLILTDGACTFNGCPTAGGVERPFAAFYPNAVQSTLFDVGFFTFVGLQVRILLDRQAASTPAGLQAARAFARISPVLAALAVAHLGSVAPVFTRLDSGADVLMLAAFAAGAVIAIALAAAVHIRVRRLSADRSPRLGAERPPPI